MVDGLRVGEDLFPGGEHFFFKEGEHFYYYFFFERGSIFFSRGGGIFVVVFFERGSIFFVFFSRGGAFVTIGKITPPCSDQNSNQLDNDINKKPSNQMT